jgi:hypothetical protein
MSRCRLRPFSRRRRWWWYEKPDDRVVYEMSLTQRDKFDQPIRLGPVSVSLLRAALPRMG